MSENARVGVKKLDPVVQRQISDVQKRQQAREQTENEKFMKE